MPSLLSIAVTYVLLRWTQRQALAQTVSRAVTVPRLSRTGQLTAAGIGAAAAALMLASACGLKLGLPTCIAGLVTLGMVSLMARASPWVFLREISWGVIPLVAGLFVLVEALDRSGVIHMLGTLMHGQVQHGGNLAAAGSAAIVGILSNLMNNLPAGLIAGTAINTVDLPPSVSSAILIGVDLGPNLSVTGSLATILWRTSLRRDGIEMKPWDFLKLGALIMAPALVLSLAGLLLRG